MLQKYLLSKLEIKITYCVMKTRRSSNGTVLLRIKGRTFTYAINKAEEGGYTASCIELPQVHTEGETLAETKKNMRDALNLTMDYLREKAKKEGGRLTKVSA